MLLIEMFVFIGTIAFAISGSLLAIQKRLDIFGVILLGLTTALAGGVIRDLMIGNIPPTNLAEPQYFLVSLLASLATILFYERIEKVTYSISLFDAIGLGVFTAVGANAALSFEFSQPFLIIAMGLVTGIGGGVLRDVFVQEIPQVFRKEVYGLASIAGSAALILSDDFVTPILSLYICLTVTFTIRMLALKWKWNIPVVERKSKIKQKSINS
ncbi:trimeric intracellular cation channel family protein [Gracilibacillus oryzae]|uniref:Trimeric intracellular cation channel family protein n=1 Tax=Gracilibacillus oryzae TaxID=1672701 RepID=A0A7C8GVP0_9BACI|nr:trimeric intracellular cation channel family protein [Gracilibacillus oryzae]KAB8138408.1 trimeric intracellular cation channel family protein [Gracilibacillus oryzae]